MLFQVKGQSQEDNFSPETRDAILQLLCFALSSFWWLVSKSRLLALKNGNGLQRVAEVPTFLWHSFNKHKSAVRSRAVAGTARQVSFSEWPSKASFPYSHREVACVQFENSRDTTLWWQRTLTALNCFLCNPSSADAGHPTNDIVAFLHGISSCPAQFSLFLSLQGLNLLFPSWKEQGLCPLNSWLLHHKYGKFHEDTGTKFKGRHV